MGEKSVYDLIEESAKVLKLDFKAADMARLASDKCFSEANLDAILSTFNCLAEKKKADVLEMLLKTSRLPIKSPKTFENYDFNRIKGKDVESLRAISSMAEVRDSINIAFIGPPGVGKTHLAEAYGWRCCMDGYKTYMLKASELRDKFVEARRFGRESKVVNALVKPTCLIIDEIGRSKFDKEATALFFDMVDRRYQKSPPCCMIFTSNKQPYEWAEFFSSDDDLKAALDRIFDKAKIFNIKGESYRGRKREIVSLEAGPGPVCD